VFDEADCTGCDFSGATVVRSSFAQAVLAGVRFDDG